MTKIIYGFYESAFAGTLLIARTEKGVCWLGLMVPTAKGDGYGLMRNHFAGADFVRDDRAVFDIGAAAERLISCGEDVDIPLDLWGTAFQKEVWDALLQIKRGFVCSYADIACKIGRKRAVRAVGSAVGANPVSFFVPCHRVVHSSGGVGNYLWGQEIKRVLLAQEGVSF